MILHTSFYIYSTKSIDPVYTVVQFIVIFLTLLLVLSILKNLGITLWRATKVLFSVIAIMWLWNNYMY